MSSEPGARGTLPVLVFLAVASFHITAGWVGGPARNWHGQTSEYYQLLTDAFLAGQTSLLVRPSDELLALPDPYDSAANGQFRLHDVSLYHGKYYLYFGPVPAIVLFLPIKVLTGAHLPSRLAVGLFCAAGFAFSCLLFFLLAKREKWDCPPWFGSAAVLSLGTAPTVSCLLSRPSFYEVAISAGYCFVMAGFLLIARSLAPDAPRKASLSGAGLCFGLAVGCRPNFALLAVLMVVLVAWRMRSSLTRVLAFAGPVFLCGVFLAAYDYARFQNPFDFGFQYALVADGAELGEHTRLNLGMLRNSLYVLLFSPAGQPPWNWAMGLVWASPVALLGLLAPGVLLYGRVRDYTKLDSSRFLLGCVYVSALSTLMLLALLRLGQSRYVVDFGPGFVWVTWCLLGAGWQVVRKLDSQRRLPFQIAVACAALYGAALDLSICWLRFR